jgi:hypothetical protein
MERIVPTHFIEVWRGEYETEGRTCARNAISELPDYLEKSKIIGVETVAVWYIKPTDVPLANRLVARLLGLGNMLSHKPKP